jgi:hypothetical protein
MYLLQLIQLLKEKHQELGNVPISVSYDDNGSVGLLDVKGVGVEDGGMNLFIDAGSDNADINKKHLELGGTGRKNFMLSTEAEARNFFVKLFRDLKLLPKDMDLAASIIAKDAVDFLQNGKGIVTEAEMMNFYKECLDDEGRTQLLEKINKVTKEKVYELTSLAYEIPSNFNEKSFKELFEVHVSNKGWNSVIATEFGIAKRINITIMKFFIRLEYDSSIKAEEINSLMSVCFSTLDLGELKIHKKEGSNEKL